MGKYLAYEALEILKEDLEQENLGVTLIRGITKMIIPIMILKMQEKTLLSLQIIILKKTIYLM